ncbi:hypothetical protein BOTBODRAFT_27062 [Botryobasidium botryosum FD-172 SS1]|uniref:Bromo domain-containing protein n=1 Tax=Botryobasidium botryosum (strain FD-172 SS1) TaxID=930990 RepID=A0A067NB85_BOTB1|nr:hypothetical protein BOTBODRAFT_27062 [Botryobasidium botryosum FD-172 SS1]
MSTRERLLLAQVVYEVGTGNWDEVSKLMSKHPLVTRPKGFFSPPACSAMHATLMGEIGYEGDKYASETRTPKARPNLALAQKWYRSRVLELKSHIMQEEEKFRSLVQEIEDIQSGKWDKQLREELKSPARPSKPVSNASRLESKSPSSSSIERPGPYSLQTIVPDSQPTSSASVLAEDITPILDEEHQAVEDVLEPGPVPSPRDAPDPLVTDNDLDDVMMSPGGELPADDQDLVSYKDEEETPRLHDESIVAETPAAESAPPMDTEETPAGDGEDEAPTSRGRQPPKRGPPNKGKRRATDAEAPQVESDRDKKRLREASESIDEDESNAGPPRRTKSSMSAAEIAASKRFQTVISLLHATISQHRNGNIFHNPIKESDAPDYHDIVRRPMDLKTIKSRIKDGLIANSTEFQRDIYLMFANAMMYNRPNSDIYQMAEEMMMESEAHIQTFRQTEGFKAK